METRRRLHRSPGPAFRPGHGSRRMSIAWVSVALLLVAGVLAACAPAVAPTATPTKAPAPAAAPTAAPAPAATPTAAAAAKAVATPAPPKPTPAPATVKAGVLRSGGESGLYVALERGYFKEQGITIETTAFTTSGDMIAPLSKGDLDLGTGAVTAGLYNAVGRGIPLVIPAGGNVLLKGSAYTSFVVRKDVYEAGAIKTPADVKGKVYSKTPGKGTASDLALDALLKQGNLTEKDIRIEELGFPEMVAAFSGKKIDWAYVTEPYVTASVENGVAVRWIPAGDIIPGAQIGSWLFSPQFAKEKSDIAKRWMIAMLKGNRDFIDAFFKGKGSKEDIAKILTKYTAVTDPAVYLKVTQPYLAPNGYVNKKSLQEQLDFHTQRGLVTEKVDLNKIVDDSIVDYAISVIGKYEEVAGAQ